MRRRWMVGLMVALALGALVLPGGMNLGPVDMVRVMASRHEHGWRDQLSPAQLHELVQERRIRSTCGYVSAWVAAEINHAGHEARIVHTLTLDEWDERNDGHTMVEVRLGDRWTLFDVDRDVWYWRDGQPLSLAELVEVAPSGNYEIRPLSGDPVLAGADLRADNQRLMQVPMVDVEGVAWFHSTDPERVQSYSPAYRAVAEADWMERFYGLDA